MSEENRTTAEHCPGNFGECLVGGSAEEQVRRKQIKRRAIAISVALQTVGLGALVIAPLLAKPPELKTVGAMPIPPYSHAVTQRNATTQTRQPRRSTYYRFSDPPPIAQLMAHSPDPEPPGPVDEPAIPGVTRGPAPGDALNIADTRTQPVRPPEQVTEKKRLVLGHVDPAMLIRRIEPIYPILPKHLHRTGKVELHAIIATDGTIQSLEAVSGDPMFVPSALEAVRQWRYRPTLLNGHPVEIDTFITVIYTMPQ